MLEKNQITGNSSLRCNELKMYKLRLNDVFSELLHEENKQNCSRQRIEAKYKVVTQIIKYGCCVPSETFQIHFLINTSNFFLIARKKFLGMKIEMLRTSLSSVRRLPSNFVSLDVSLSHQLYYGNFRSSEEPKVQHLFYAFLNSTKRSKFRLKTICLFAYLPPQQRAPNTHLKSRGNTHVSLQQEGSLLNATRA